MQEHQRDRQAREPIAQHDQEVSEGQRERGTEVPAARRADQAVAVRRVAGCGREGRRAAPQAPAAHRQGVACRAQGRRLKRDSAETLKASSPGKPRSRKMQSILQCTCYFCPIRLDVIDGTSDANCHRQVSVRQGEGGCNYRRSKRGRID
jgi:hypothetical protein